MLFNKPNFRQFILINILIISVLSSKVAFTNSNLKEQIFSDYHQFYREDHILQRYIALNASGILANTDIDPHFRNYWQNHVRSKLTNNDSKIITDYTKLSNYPSAVPFYFITMWLSSLLEPLTGLEGWANHSLRTILVGFPEQFILSHLLGGGRPPTGHPEWDPFKYHRAVSGHAFYGAIPLINFAKQTNEPLLKFGCYLLSLLPGLARINDDKHYLSQVTIGWWLAYTATNAVWESDTVRQSSQNKNLYISLLDHGIYLGLNANF